MLKSGFRDKGIATTVAARSGCRAGVLLRPRRGANDKSATRSSARRSRPRTSPTIKWPSDGKWLGDWKAGEQVAQSGRGLTSSDKADVVNGGNCYNCHQLSPKEISYGTIGPSLYNYGKLRGTGEESLRYTWGRIYNAKAFNACSNMPRAGHMGIITEQQIRDLMALLLDPQSPVNQ